MPERVLAFVNAAGEAPGDPGTLAIVLSPWWTARSGEALSVESVRTPVSAVLGEVDLLATSTQLLDGWAAATGIPALFALDGVGWWDRVRMALRWDMYELVLWRHVLSRLDASARFDRVEVPADRPHLAAACRAAGLADRLLVREPDPVPVEPDPTGTSERPATGPAPGPAPVPPRASMLRRAARRLRRLALVAARRPVPPAPPPSYAARLAALDRRVRGLARRPGVLVVAWSGAYQVVGDSGAVRMGDPFLDPAVQLLRRRGDRVTLAVQGINLRRATGWYEVAGNPICVPQAYVTERWDGRDGHDLDVGPLRDALLERARMPLDVDGADLAPALAELIAGYAGDWIVERRRLTRSIGGFLDVLRPTAVLLDREGTRLPWIAAARARGIPVVTTQHGMIYPGNPEYFRPPGAGLARPDRTCVFGPWERDLLVGAAGYEPTEIVVTGSPRVSTLEVPRVAAEVRDTVRQELGVAAGDRLLVVSAAHSVIGELLTACMLEAVLAGPLPGVHAVIKVHPQDHEPADFAGFLDGLARVGGWTPPPVSVVRDIELGRLLGAADAHLGGSSTMLTDAVAAGLPNMVALGQAQADPLGYVREGVAVGVRSVEDVQAVMADPRPPAPEARLAFLERHFLPGDATERLVDAVRDAAAAAAAGRTS